MNKVKDEYQQLIAIFNLVKSKTVNIYSVLQSVKLLLALSIYLFYHCPAIGIQTVTRLLGEFKTQKTAENHNFYVKLNNKQI